MPQLLHSVAFWIAIIVAARVAVCYPHSAFSRFLLSRIAPTRSAGESRRCYRMRCASLAVGWFAQAAVLVSLGWVALRFDASLADSLYFMVMWIAVVPAVATCALLVALSSLALALLTREPSTADRARLAARKLGSAA
ncbi:MAG TPA: hypothetical protein VMV45_05425 [Casimicrobiaceae bacterium]|nr:hypothetical protein [Casimicrobiaceae bacterium]